MASPAAAQSRPDVDVQTFDPALQPNGIFTIDSSSTLDHLQPGGTFVLDYLSEPLVAGSDADNQAIVDQQLAADLVAGIGLLDRFQLEVHLPVYIVNDAQWAGEDVGGFSAGDLSVRPKGRIVSQETAGVGLAAALDVTFPTGAGQKFVGASTVTATPEIIVDRTFGDLLLAGNFGFRFQGNETLGDRNVGDAFTYSLGAEYAFVDGVLRLGGELNGSTQLNNFFGDVEESPLELLLGAKVITDSGFAIMAGSGGGLAPGVGAPEFRAFLGISYPTGKQDADGDGIMDGEDECPDKPEDLDGFEDADGCPDTDNDGDGIPDDVDQCPDKPEDKNGFQDDDGCPDADKDSDGDGIPDADDECPDKPEDKNGFQDDDGCPDADVDSDGDGVADADDECPDEVGVEAQNGCPPEEKKAVLKDDEIEIKDKIYFETDSDVLEDRSHAVLDQVAYVLTKNPDVEKVEIKGHTDSSGSTSHNQELSQKRADAVRTYLIEEHGIDDSRLVAQGYGASEPVIEDASEEERAKNRRVEFKISEDDDQEDDGSDEE